LHVLTENTVQYEKIPLSVPKISGNEWEYVKDCLDTGWVSSAGAYVKRFENDICSLTGADHAVACVNGTAALHTALLVLGTKPDDEVIVPTVTFIASVNAVSYAGAVPVFMDCDDYYNIDVAKTLDFITNETIFKDGFTYNKQTGRRIRALIAVHVLGNAADLESLILICRERNIKIVEDAAESLGTRYTGGILDGHWTGTVGDIGCYSFNGNKIVTAGGGGMLVTNDPSYSEKAEYLTTQAKDDVVRYVHDEIGYNSRLTNIQAAIAVAQLEQLLEFIAVKKKNYGIYQEAIKQIDGLTLADTPGYADNNCWMYALQIDQDRYGQDKESLMTELTKNGIQSHPLWHLNHMQKPYSTCQAYRIKKAHCMYDRTLMLPCSTSLTEDDCCFVTDRLDFMNNVKIL